MKAGDIGKFPVSCFLMSGTRKVSCNTTLEWVLNDYFGSMEVKAQTAHLRSLPYGSDEYKEYKKTMFAATISCACNEVRLTESVIYRNPLLCIDIDLKDNQSLADQTYRTSFMNSLFRNKCIYAVGTSCSGKGIYAIILLSSNTDKEDFIAAFNSVEDDMKKADIKLDAACKDITRLRIACSDPILIKSTDEDVEPYTRRLKPEIQEVVHAPMSSRIRGTSKHDIFLAVFEMLLQSGFSADNYFDWLTAAFALHAVPGGHDLFQRLSEQSSDYKGPSDVNQKWTSTSNSRFTCDSAYAFFFSKAKQLIGDDYMSRAIGYCNKCHLKKNNSLNVIQR